MVVKFFKNIFFNAQEDSYVGLKALNTKPELKKEEKTKEKKVNKNNLKISDLMKKTS